MANVPRRFSVLSDLRRQAEARGALDYAATRRAQAAQEEWLEYQTWQAVSNFQNGWGNAVLDPAWEPYTSEGRETAQYFRDRWGFVHLKGIVSNPGFSTGPVFTLPPELAPMQNEYFPSMYKTTAASGTTAGIPIGYTCLAYVNQFGEVHFDSYYSTAGFTNVKWATLDGMSFQAANVGEPVA